MAFDNRSSPPALGALSAVKLTHVAAQLRSRVEAVLSDPIAVVGMGCRFPGPASTPMEFWARLCEGAACTREVPPTRWDSSTSSMTRTRTRRARCIRVTQG